MEKLAPQKRRYTVEEYLRLERAAIDKHEFRDGEIVCMSGGTVVHSLITANVGGELHNLVKRGPCRVYDSNLRVRIKHRGLYSYPDVTVICDRAEMDPDDAGGETVTNPRLVVEVLSPSTEAYCRKAKFDLYRELQSFVEYALVSQDAARVETFFRQPDGGWVFDVAVGVDKSIRLRSLNVGLLLAEVYAGVEFPPPTDPPPEAGNATR